MTAKQTKLPPDWMAKALAGAGIAISVAAVILVILGAWPILILVPFGPVMVLWARRALRTSAAIRQIMELNKR